MNVTVNPDLQGASGIASLGNDHELMYKSKGHTNHSNNWKQNRQNKGKGAMLKENAKIKAIHCLYY